MARKQPETRFKEKILPILQKLPNSYFIKTQMVALLGVPDIIGCVSGKFCALELKRNSKEAKRLTGRVRLQGHILLLIRNAGGYAEFCYPENWEAIFSDLSKIADPKTVNNHVSFFR